jgi:hypothetical protein
MKLQLHNYPAYIHNFYVKCVPCHHGMARPQIADEVSGLQIWRVAVNILYKQSRTADKGWSSIWDLERGMSGVSIGQVL